MGGCVSVGERESQDASCMPKLKWRKKSIKSFSEEDYDGERLLKRMCSNGASKVACVFTQQGRKGINQDAMVVWEDFVFDDTIFCGVFDGHGPYGHLVARKVRDSLPMKLHSYWNSFKEKADNSHGPDASKKKSNKNASNDCGAEVSSAMETRLFSAWKETYLKAYKVMDKELRSNQFIDCFCSGSTAVAVVKQGQYLFIGNIGDSRAVLGTKAPDDSIIPIQLTVDLKPDLPREAERIQQCKGRVFALRDEPEVQRVWLPYDDAPGLAMARAFGDFCLKEYGVIAIPEVSSRLLTERDKFVVLASDGVWDVLSNEEVVQIVSSAPTRSLAARTLVEAAVREWRFKYPTSKMDDCAVVCLYLDTKMEDQLGPENTSASANCIDHIDPLDVVVNELKDTCTGKPCDQTEEEGPLLQRLFTVRATDDSQSCLQSIVILEPSKELNDGCDGNILDPIEPLDATAQNWSGLEGVTRVNSLVQLPRFPEEKCL
uniref:protein-serine/threonine phosphatase n=1 Tax=Wollemia nobilis TaxID=56998 RepID=A0A0C9RH25_9CONI